MNDLENMSHEDALEWYENWYAPNNAILVVAGDVNPQEIFALAEKYYGPISSKKIKERKPQIEAEQMGVRRAEVKAPSKLSYLQMAYKVPALDKDLTKNNTDVYALEVLAGILSNTSASRLNQSLVNDQGLALGAGASYAMITRGGMSLFEFYATPSEATPVIDVEDAIKKEVEKIIQSGVTEDELNRIKTSVIASKVYQQDSVFYQAMQIGQLETIGYPYT
jgi:zinc protease